MLGNEIDSEPAFAKILDGASEVIDLTIVFFLRTSAIFKHWLDSAFGLASVVPGVADGYGRGTRLALRSAEGGLLCEEGVHLHVVGVR